MMPFRHKTLLTVAFWQLTMLLCCHSGFAADWISAPSYYTHDTATAQRVTQFAPIGPFYVYTPPNYVKSGYRHYRSTIQAGGSADNLHVVEEWGRPVVPYEQWRFPYRPYGAPYQDWGPPYAGTGVNQTNNFGGGLGSGSLGGGLGGGFGGGGGGFGGGGGGSGGNYPYYQQQGPAPWVDGYWPTYNSRDRSRYYNPYPSGDGGSGW